MNWSVAIVLFSSFDWYIPQLSVLNANEAPSPRLGHVAAIFGDKMYVFGGHTVAMTGSNQEISNELFELNLQTMNWKKLGPTNDNAVQPLAYMANTVLIS